MTQRTFHGGCLCGAIRYTVVAEPTFPHLCSCTMCRRWSGAPTVAWVEFPEKDLIWENDLAPSFFRSSKKTSRGFCAKCGSSICAIDEGYENVSIAIGSLDRPNMVVPNEAHSFARFKPKWWKPEIEADSIA